MKARQRTIAVAVAVAVVGMVAFGVPGAITAQEDTPTPTEATPAEETPTEATPANETPTEETPTAETPTEETPGADAADAAAVTIENQTSNGTAVTVNETTLPEGGFVAVFNATLASPLGSSAYLEAGSQEDVNVSLNETLSENASVVVAAFEDTDGNQQFDFGTDEVYVSQQELAVDVAQVNVTAAEATDTETETEVNETATAVAANETATATEMNETATATELNETATEMNETETETGTPVDANETEAPVDENETAVEANETDETPTATLIEDATPTAEVTPTPTLIEPEENATQED